MPDQMVSPVSSLIAAEAAATALDNEFNSPMRSKHPYSSRIIKAGALLADTKMLLTHWDESLSTEENLDVFKRENLFGKSSRSRTRDILNVFSQRYLRDSAVTNALVHFVKSGLSDEPLRRVLFFHSAQSDQLLHDVVVEVLWDFYRRGKIDVYVDELQSKLTGWVREDKTAAKWKPYTILRVAQGILATLRDFGILQGKGNKHLAPVHLPTSAFAYVAFYLHLQQPSGEKLIKHPEWRLFLLSLDEVERLFLEAIPCVVLSDTMFTCKLPHRRRSGQDPRHQPDTRQFA